MEQKASKTLARIQHFSLWIESKMEEGGEDDAKISISTTEWSEEKRRKKHDERKNLSKTKLVKGNKRIKMIHIQGS